MITNYVHVCCKCLRHIRVSKEYYERKSKEAKKKNYNKMICNKCNNSNTHYYFNDNGYYDFIKC
jgi:hypothetical protein